MIFTRLDKQYFDLFGDLDPFSMLDNLSAKGRFAMGLWGKHEGYDYPVGLVICEETSDSLVINWMMVDSVVREQGFGSYMIAKLISLAKKYNKTKMQAVFPYSPAREILCRGEKIYFKQYGFTNESSLDGVTYLTLSSDYFDVNQNIGSRHRAGFLYELENMINDLDKLDEEIGTFDGAGYVSFTLKELADTKIMASIDDINTVEALSDLDIHDMVKIVDETMQSEWRGIVIVSQDDFNISEVDLDVSCVIKRNEKIEALLLISLSGDNSLVMRKFVVSNNLNRLSIAFLLKYSYKIMTQKYSDVCKIFIPKEGENTEILIKALQDTEMED